MSCVKMSERGFQVVHPLGLLSWSSRDVRVKFEHGECIFPVENLHRIPQHTALPPCKTNHAPTWLRQARDGTADASHLCIFVSGVTICSACAGSDVKLVSLS